MKPLLTLLICIVAGILSASSPAMGAEVNDTVTLQRNGYLIHYPKNWKIHYGEKGEVVFSFTAPDTKSKISTNIQTIYTKAHSGKYKSVKELMDDFLIQVPMHAQDARLFDRKPYTLTEPDGSHLTGEQITVTFIENKQTYKQWQIMLMTDNGVLFQAFAYRAPLPLYDEYLPVANSMLTSWVIQ